MISQLITTETLSNPWPAQWNDYRPSAFLRRVNTQRLKQSLAASALVVTVGMILAATGSLSQGGAPATAANPVRMPYGWVSAKTSVFQQATPTKPHKTTPAPAAAPICHDPQTEDAALFATCASLSLNFATHAKGPINTGLFNIFVGNPGVNQEAQVYTGNLQNLRIENGNLLLQAQRDPQEGANYTSARIDTKGKEDFLYGKLVVRATLPNGIGAWPAIWMLPSNPKYAGLSPDTNFSRYLNDGEIDIAESAGVDAHRVYGIAHSLNYPPDGPDRSYYNTIMLPDNSTTFHDYGVNWTPTNLTFTVDGQPYFSISKQPGADYRSWPYDQPFYLILNLALGGTWGGSDRKHFPVDGIDNSALPAVMAVQYVHYYPYTGKP